MPKSSISRSEVLSLGAYDARLDPEIRAFVARTNAWYPAGTENLPIERQRAIYNAMCQALHCGTPAGIGASDSIITLPEELDRRTRLGAELCDFRTGPNDQQPTLELAARLNR